MVYKKKKNVYMILNTTTPLPVYRRMLKFGPFFLSNSDKHTLVVITVFINKLLPDLMDFCFFCSKTILSLKSDMWVLRFILKWRFNLTSSAAYLI